MNYQLNSFQNESFGISDSKQNSYAYPPNIRRNSWVRWYSIYLCTLALDCENSEEPPCEKGEYVDDIEYETPDLSGGVEGIDYGIFYGLGDEEMDIEAEA